MVFLAPLIGAKKINNEKWFLYLFFQITTNKKTNNITYNNLSEGSTVGVIE